MRYEYKVLSVGTSVWNALEDLGKHLEEALNSDPVNEHVTQGWEVWQTNTLYGHQALDNKGFLIILRRSRP